MDTIFVALSTFSAADAKPLDLLKTSGISYKIHTTGKRITRDELLAEAANATVIVAGVEPYDESLLESLPKLRCIVRCGVGVDTVDLAAAKKRNITILNTPDVPATAVAELAISMYFSLSRNLRPQANSMGMRKWERLESHLVSGKTLGIIGFGRIGRKIAEYCKPFAMQLLVCDPLLTKETLDNSHAQLVKMETLLANADIVSIHASKSNSLILNADDYTKMRKGAILVNLSRGGMIDEQGLVNALQSKHLAGAGLDVFEEEPYTGPLCDFENVILTPHCATLPIETRVAMEYECIDKAVRFVNNSILPEEKVI